jgi:hypothetical protein
LLSHELSDDEQSTFIARMRDRLAGLASEIAEGHYLTADQVPDEIDVLGRVRKWLAEHDGRAIANSPRVEG